MTRNGSGVVFNDYDEIRIPHRFRNSRTVPAARPVRGDEASGGGLRAGRPARCLPGEPSGPFATGSSDAVACRLSCATHADLLDVGFPGRSHKERIQAGPRLYDCFSTTARAGALAGVPLPTRNPQEIPP